MQRLPLETWANIFRNVQEHVEETKKNGEEWKLEGKEWIEVSWLDSSDEWVLHYDCELFEDGFRSEREAQERLEYLEKELL